MDTSTNNLKLNIIGEDIKRTRKYRGLTQKKLGELCGIAESNIRKYENGKQNPKKETLQKIANALNARVFYDCITHQLTLIPLGNNQSPADSYPDIIERLTRGERLSPMELLILGDLMHENERSAQNYPKNFRRIEFAYSQLNESGQEKAADYTEDLTKIPEYRKEPKPENSGTPE